MTHFNSGGYVLVKAHGHPNGQVGGFILEHRLVASRMLGRPLRSDEVVHHANGNPADNRPENLEVYSSNGLHHRVCHGNRNWTAEQDCDLIERWRQQDTASSIAAATGRTIWAIRSRINLLRRRNVQLDAGKSGRPVMAWCPQGHQYVVIDSGLKCCRACRRENTRRYRAKAAAHTAQWRKEIKDG